MAGITERVQIGFRRAEPPCVFKMAEIRPTTEPNGYRIAVVTTNPCNLVDFAIIYVLSSLSSVRVDR